MARLAVLLCVLGWLPAVLAAEGAEGAATVTVCFNYGCAAQARVDFDETALAGALSLLDGAEDAAAEREAVALAVGRLYQLAALSTPIAADRAGNYLDDGVDGRMDCIDHSRTTTALLELIAARGQLRFHRVLTPARRSRFIFQHFSAQLEETAARSAAALPAAAGATRLEVADGLVLDQAAGLRPPARHQGRYVIDSWFVNNGEAAIVLPLAEWLKGGGPNVW